MRITPSATKHLAVLAALAVLATGCGSETKNEAADKAQVVAATPSPVDSDGDGVADDEDLRPNDASIQSGDDLDTDGDGVKDGEDYRLSDPKVQTRNDIDTDKDGVADFKDAFPRDASYSKDSDSDRVADALDAFPKDARYSKDADRDGVADAEDAFPTDPSRSEITLAMENSIDSAESYLAMGGMSRQGLIDQLSSNYGEGFGLADAEWAVSQLDVNWNEQAYQSAKSYQEMGGMSRQGLIEQLSSPYGEQFTLAEATYAVNKLGL